MNEVQKTIARAAFRRYIEGRDDGTAAELALAAGWEPGNEEKASEELARLVGYLINARKPRRHPDPSKRNLYVFGPSREALACILSMILELEGVSDAIDAAIGELFEEADSK